MNLSLTQPQALLLQECLKLYDTQLLTSSKDWKEYDNLFEKLAGLSDTRSYDDFCQEDPYEPNLYEDSQYSDKSYWIDKHNPWKDLQKDKQKHGKDMDLLS